MKLKKLEMAQSSYAECTFTGPDADCWSGSSLLPDRWALCVGHQLSCVEVSQDRGQAFCSEHQFPEHVEGLNVLTWRVRSFSAADVKYICCPPSLLYTRRQETSRRTGLVQDFMLSLFMLWILFLLGGKPQCAALLALLSLSAVVEVLRFSVWKPITGSKKKEKRMKLKMLVFEEKLITYM